MELPDRPPGTEGYDDTVVEVAKKSMLEEGTKAEQEFLEHLNSLKIKVENGTTRCMVERRGRDVSGKWIYLCYPCAAVCSGESILQTHISGKKHKVKLSARVVWPLSIFDEHPYVLSEKGMNKNKTGEATEQVLMKIAEEVNIFNKDVTELDEKYNSLRNVRCHIQDSLDSIKAPVLGVEYLVEHPPEEPHHEPSYICSLCNKQGHPRTIINHLTCFWHRYNYLLRHFSKASTMLSPYKSQASYREGVAIIMNRISQRIEDKFGRMKPVNIDKAVYDKEKDRIHLWIYKGKHFTEKDGHTFEEVVDIDLIESLNKKGGYSFPSKYEKKDPSPPVVKAPSKSLFNSYSRPAGRQARRPDGAASDDDGDRPSAHRPVRGRPDSHQNRYDPYRDKRRESPGRPEKQKPPNYEYKVKLAEEQRLAAEDAAKKTLAYHEKNPEKHPLYPEEWKKFWNRRYKEIQSEGKDPSKHDYKPEWIVFWTARMKELHDEELRVHLSEIYRKMCLSPPPLVSERKNDKAKSPAEQKHSDLKRRSPELKRRSPDLRRRSPELRRRSPEPRRRSPEPRRRSPFSRRRSPDFRRRSPDLRRRSSDPRRRSPDPRRRSPEVHRRSPPRYLHQHKRSNDRFKRDYRSPMIQKRLISPHSLSRPRSRSPLRREGRGSGSPLSRRSDAQPLRNRSRSPPPSLQTVLVSDEEFRPEDGPSPWDSEAESLGSLPEVRSPAAAAAAGGPAPTGAARHGAGAPPSAADLGPPENVVATLRLLVALEDYLGSIGPKLLDLLAEAIKMEKERANSSEELLLRESAVVLLETAKEKLKGAAQAGLVPGAAAAAARTAVVRVAATLHAADRAAAAAKKASKPPQAAAAVPVAGVGEVDRAQIAQQMAAALIAQGKTDVSSEELAQLVDAVVGMAEAKKREQKERKQEPAPAPAPAPAAPASAAAAEKNSASALQMLQSAYDENEKKIEAESHTPDAMDGLSDSDLETLLKNFNELSAEEQHSLIAYLKKLEAREPQRVERLRQYVNAAEPTLLSAAAVSVPVPVPVHVPVSVTVPVTVSVPDVPAPAASQPVVTVESDDDDYTVEEVFKSATQKVKEDQIRQEMEIVKKSLEETKGAPVLSEVKELPKEDTRMNFSSATDLFALVQASIQSTAAATSDVVDSKTQPRSFGDLPEAPGSISEVRPHFPNPTSNQSGLLRLPLTNRSNQNQPYDNNDFNKKTDNTSDGKLFAQTGPIMQDNRIPLLPDNRGPVQQNRGPLLQDNRGPLLQDNRGPLLQDNRGPLLQDNRGPLLQDNRGPLLQDNRGPLLQDNRGPLLQDTRGPLLQNNRGPLLQDNRGPLLQDNRGSLLQDNRGSPMLDNRGPPIQNSRVMHMQDNRGQLMQNNRGQPMQNNRGQQMQDNRGQQIQDNRRQQMQDNRGHPMQDNRGHPMQDNRGHPMQDHRGQSMQDNRSQQMQDNRGQHMQDNIVQQIQDNRGQQPQNNRGQQMQDNRGQQITDYRDSPTQINRGGHYKQEQSGPFMRDNNVPYMQGGPPIQDNRGPYVQENRGPPNQYNRGNFTQENPSMRDNRGPLMQDNRSSYRPYMQDNSAPYMQGGAPMQDNRGAYMQNNRGPSNQYNRGNFRPENPSMRDNRGPHMNDNRGPRHPFH